MPRLLLDTPVFLWWVDASANLTGPARSAISDPRNECYLSVASCWEMAIKSSLGKLRLPCPIERFALEQLTANNFTLLNIELRHIAKTEKLPFHHRDPFDRLLIAQALSEKLTVVAADTRFSEYGVKVIW
jgi:PIN domain nuclease of toxin-antitoxin system